MSVFNRMPSSVRTFVVVMAVVVLFALIVYIGRLILDGTILHEEKQYAEVVKMEKVETQTAEAAPVEAFDPATYVADIAKGKKLSGKCKACHSFDQGGKAKTGPNLWNIVGAEMAAVDGFRYSTALEAKKGEVWNDEALSAFLAKPRDYIKGTKMAFGGIKKEQQRMDLIAWLKTLK